MLIGGRVNQAMAMGTHVSQNHPKSNLRQEAIPATNGFFRLSKSLPCFVFRGGSTIVPSFAYGLTRRRGFPPFVPRRGLQRRPVPLAAGLPRAAAALQREGAVPQRRHMQAWDREGGP